jgi:hypothetical protein
MADRYARCLNFDYCTLGDRRLVLRLAPGEPFFCPECAQALISARAWRSGSRISWSAVGSTAMGAAAIAACALVVQHWPQQIAALVPHWMAPAPPMAPPSEVDIIRGTAPPTGLPDPAKLFLAATMDESMPRGAGSYILREHHRRPPHSDPAAVEAMAQLRAGVQGLPTPEHLTRATMPWHQAMIMAALLAPGQSLGPAGVPQLPVNLPAVPDPPPAPAAAQPPLPPTGAPAGAAVMRIPDRRADAVTEWPASAAAGRLPIQLASLTVPIETISTPATASVHARKPPKPIIAHKQAAAAVPAPAPPVATKQPTKVAASPPPDQTGAVGPVIPSAPGEPPISVVDVPPDDTPPPAKRVVIVPSGSNFSFGPMNDGSLNTEPIRPVFIPLRPSAAKPQEAKVTLNCIIETSGVPSHCLVVSSTHAGGLSEAMADWLSSGMVRRPPKSVDGHLVRSRQILVLHYPAEAQAPERLK